MNKLLSIIIPTYNMERYLNKCLDSLLIGQNFDKLEVLVINDGSKDRSSEIAHEYEKKHPNVFRVIDKENGNYGSCINRGLKEATGKYLKVLDADDSFENKNFNIFVNQLKNIDADMILSDYIEINENENFKRTHSFCMTHNKTIKFCDVYKSLFCEDFQMHAVTYKRENLIKIHYEQSVGISYTDLEWLFKPIIMVEKVHYINITIYKYLIGRAGQTSDPKVLDRSIAHFVHILTKMIYDYSYYLKSNVPISNYLEYRILQLARRVYKMLLLPINTNYKADLTSQIDEFIKVNNMIIYQKLENIPIHRLLPFKYIHYYRQHKKRPPLYIRHINDMMKKIQYAITYHGV